MPKANHQPRVPKTRVLAHMDSLIEKFPTLTYSHIAALAGVSNGTLSSARQRQNITIDVEARLLAVTLDHVRLVPPRHVPSAAVVRHTRRLLDLPRVSASSLARVAGLSYQTVINVARDRHDGVRFSTHLALMAVTPEMALAGIARLDPRPTITRCRALEAQGWPLSTQGRLSGVQVNTLVRERTNYITVPIAAKVKDMYDRIGDAPGPDTSAKAWARKAGYWPSVHYDEDMRLIPESLPSPEDEAEAKRQARGRRALVSAGLSLRGKLPREIAEVLGIRPDSAVAYRDRMGLRIVRGADAEAVVLADAQGPLIAAIEARIDGIDLTTPYDAYDEPGIDYYARFDELRSGAWVRDLVRPQAAAWVRPIEHRMVAIAA